MKISAVALVVLASIPAFAAKPSPPMYGDEWIMDLEPYAVPAAKAPVATAELDSSDGTCTLSDVIICQNRCVDEASQPGWILQAVECNNQGDNCRCISVSIGPYNPPCYWNCTSRTGRTALY